MKRSTLNKIIAALAFAGFILLTTTGILIHYILPAGSKHFRTIWGMDRHDWGSIHFGIAVCFFCILTAHLILHWRWVVNLFAGQKGEGSYHRFVLGLISIFSLVALAVSPLFSPVQLSSKGESSCDICLTKDHEKIRIFGSMTLLEAAQSTNVPLSHILSQLDLPADTRTDINLGKLRKAHGFEIEDVRRVICDYKTKNRN